MKYQVKGDINNPDNICVVEVTQERYRGDKFTFNTREEAEAEAKRIKTNLKANARRSEARAERIRRLEEYDKTWCPGIKCILDRVNDKQVDKILEGLDHMRGSITG